MFLRRKIHLRRKIQSGDSGWGDLHNKLKTDARIMSEISEHESAVEYENMSLQSANAEKTSKAFPEGREQNEEIKRTGSFKRWWSAADYTKSQIIRSVCHRPREYSDKDLAEDLGRHLSFRDARLRSKSNLNSFQYMRKSFFFMIR